MQPEQMQTTMAASHAPVQRERPALGSAPVPPLDPIEKFAEIQRFRRDQGICAEGEPVGYCYRPVSGAVRSVKLLEDGRRQVIAFFLPGDLLGFDLPERHAFSLEAVTDTVVKRYPRRVVEAASEQSPAMARLVRETMQQSLRQAQGRIVQLGRKKAGERLAGFLLEMAERTHVANRAVLDLPMARTDIADHLGLTVETVCRELSRLRRDRAITVNGTRIAIGDWRSLREAGGDRCH